MQSRFECQIVCTLAFDVGTAEELQFVGLLYSSIVRLNIPTNYIVCSIFDFFFLCFEFPYIFHFNSFSFSLSSLTRPESSIMMSERETMGVRQLKIVGIFFLHCSLISYS